MDLWISDLVYFIFLMVSDSHAFGSQGFFSFLKYIFMFDFIFLLYLNYHE